MRVRLIKFSDLKQVIAIENESFEFPWRMGELFNALRRRDVNGLVCEHKGQVLGFCIYERSLRAMLLLSIATAPEYRKCGIGGLLFGELASKLTARAERSIKMIVRESNLEALRFFRSQGCHATGLIKSSYSETVEDAVAMQYDMPLTGGDVWDLVLQEAL